MNWVPIFGLGCAGGITGLAIASRLAEAMPGSTVLVVVEVCTLAFRLDKVTKANLVATALFGDGAAACIVRVGEEGIAEVTGSGEHMWPGTLGIMGWEVEAQGFGVIFDRAIPPFAEHNLAGALSAILSKTGIDPQHIDRLLCHPGGAKVVTSIEQALALPEGTLDHERAVLRDFGNMSAPTALFVLAQALRAGLPRNAAVARARSWLHRKLRNPCESDVTASSLILAFITAQRLIELWFSRRNTARLLALGGYEHAPAQYPFLVLVHASWLAGLWLLAWSRPINPWWLGCFGVLQVMRIWVLVTLGRRWTTASSFCRAHRS